MSASVVASVHAKVDLVETHLIGTQGHALELHVGDADAGGSEATAEGFMTAHPPLKCPLQTATIGRWHLEGNAQPPGSGGLARCAH